MADIILETRCLTVSAGGRPILHETTLCIEQGSIFGIMGPSGAGKSTLLKCLNRLVDLTPGLQVGGDVLFHGRPVSGPDVDPDLLRERIGMIFQQPVVFPQSIYKNVLFGVRHLRRVASSAWPQVAEQSLRAVALWDEVKDRLHSPALKLSVGQQQRLCLARTLALKPEVILLDEPTSALDARSTEAIEQLLMELKSTHTLVLVTHQQEQARRVCDQVVEFEVVDSAGRLK